MENNEVRFLFVPEDLSDWVKENFPILKEHISTEFLYEETIFVISKDQKRNFVDNNGILYFSTDSLPFVSDSVHRFFKDVRDTKNLKDSVNGLVLKFLKKDGEYHA